MAKKTVKKIKLPTRDEMRKSFIANIYGEWKGGTCQDYVAGWKLHELLFDSMLRYAENECSETELELSSIFALSVAAETQPSVLYPLLCGVMAEILNVVVSDRKIAQRLRKKFLKLGGFSDEE